MLQISSLSKSFDGQTVLRDLTLEISPGEILSLIGPNGSGKTTTIKIIAGLLQPTKGSVTVCGYESQRQPVEAKAQLGYIPDDPVIWSGMTGEEFLHFTATLYGVNEKIRVTRIKKLLDAYGIRSQAGGLFEDYSRGTRQKFSIVAALLHQPKVLIIDEPIVGLDPDSIDTTLELLKQYAKDGGAVLIVAHTLPVIEQLTTRVGILSKGVLLAMGTVAELRKQAGLSGGSSLHEVYQHFIKR